MQTGDEVELIPGGRDIPVTARNRMQVGTALAYSSIIDCHSSRWAKVHSICSFQYVHPRNLLRVVQYIYAVADWRLNQAVSRQSTALLRGLREVIPAAWLAPFSAPELQVDASLVL